MSEELRRRCAYLEALARLQPRWDHDARGHLGAIKIQFDLLVAEIAHVHGATIDVGKITPSIERGLNVIQAFYDAMKVQHGIWRWGAETGDLFDLAGHVKRMPSLLGPCAEFELQLALSVITPSGPLWIEGGEPALREAVTIAAIEMLFLGTPGGAVAMRLEADPDRAQLRIEGPRLPGQELPWLAAVRETLANFGGRVEAGGELDLIIPMAAVPR